MVIKSYKFNLLQRFKIVLTIKPKKYTNFSNFFRMELYMFRTGFLSILKSPALYTQR